MKPEEILSKAVENAKWNPHDGAPVTVPSFIVFEAIRIAQKEEKEKTLRHCMSHSELSAFLIWAYKNSWYIAKNEGEDLYWQNYFSDDSISISNLIGLFKKSNK